MKAVAKMLGKLDVVERRGGRQWEADNWRHQIEGCSGVVSICESERKYPGHKFVRFELVAEEGKEGQLVRAPQKALTTSYGNEAADGEGGFSFSTSNSVYRFSALKKKATKAYLRTWGLSRTQLGFLLEAGDGGPSTEQVGGTGTGMDTGPGHAFWTYADIARVLGKYEDEVVQATDAVLGHTTVSLSRDGSTLVHSSDVARFKRWFHEQRKDHRATDEKKRRNDADSSGLRVYTTRAIPNALLHIRDYSDLAWFTEEVLAMSAEPIPLLSQYEADRTLVSALVGFVFDCGNLFAYPERLGRNHPDYQFETVAALALFDEPVLDNIFRQLGLGERYDRDAHEWIRDPLSTAKQNGIAYTQWQAFRARGLAERRGSFARCRKLLSYLADEGIEEFQGRLIRCALDREIYYMGRFA